jgi:hypothetical protein
VLQLNQDDFPKNQQTIRPILSVNHFFPEDQTAAQQGDGQGKVHTSNQEHKKI